MTTLTLVRHGQASFGSTHYDRLSDRGRKQAQILGQYWRSLGFPSPGAVYAGRMSRQLDTAALALPGTEVVTDPGFNEYDFEGIQRQIFPLVAREHPELIPDPRTSFKNPKSFQRLFEKSVAFWVAGRASDQTKMESWQQFRQRVRASLHAATPADQEHVVVFTSGGVIAVALQQALQVSDEMVFKLNWRIYNASVHSFSVGRSGLSLLGFNDIAHLQQQRDAALLTFR